jgi:hypothetical protein
MTVERKREGEIALTFDPGSVADETEAFIGHISTPWQKGHCPKEPDRSAQPRWPVPRPCRQGLQGRARCSVPASGGSGLG